MSKSEAPEYLYHYTSIETLALVLKNKTIRFNSLSKMDDLQEQASSDKQNFGDFTFVSSWTDDPNETIPMWKMYAKRDNSSGGVRLKLPAYPFKEWRFDQNTIIRHAGIEAMKNISSMIPYDTYIPERIYLDYFCAPNVQAEILHKIQYTSDSRKLYPQVFETTSNKDGTFNITINPSKIGRAKNPYWNFQNEWRYIFYIYPFSLITQITNHPDETQNIREEMFTNMHRGVATLPISYVDIPLREDAYSSIEIVLSPTASDSSEIIVDSLVSKYCPAAKIKSSELKGLIK